MKVQKELFLLPYRLEFNPSIYVLLIEVLKHSISGMSIMFPMISQHHFLSGDDDTVSKVSATALFLCTEAVLRGSLWLQQRGTYTVFFLVEIHVHFFFLLSIYLNSKHFRVIQ